MKKLLILLFSLFISFHSYGASDEPILYSYNSYDFDNASKYTISNGDGDQFGCIMTQFIFSKEALNALKDNNKEVMDSLFLSDKLTAANILLYKDKVHWLDTDQYSKIQTNLVNQNFINLESPNADVESLLFQLINKDDELIFRMKTPNNGSTLVCDFPFIKIEVDEEGLPIQSICWETADNIKWNEDYTTLFLVTKYNVEPFTGKNICSLENVPYVEGNFLNGKEDGKWTWYENGQKVIEENYKDGKRDGKTIEWEKNGQFWSEGHYNDANNKDGKWTFWYKNGQKLIEENYKDGVLDGKSTSWHENGQLISKGYHQDDRKNGKWIFWYKNGQKKEETNYKNGYGDGKSSSWHENGQKKEETNFIDGNQDGMWIVWYENGQQESEENYKDGVLDGKSTSWHENGQKKIEGGYKDDKRDVMWIFWYKNGQKELERNYKNGKVDGIWKSWYDNGQKKSEGIYKEGVLDGKSTSWTENGQKQLDVNYKDGKYDGKYTYWFADDWIVERLYKDGVCISGDC